MGKMKNVTKKTPSSWLFAPRPQVVAARYSPPEVELGKDFNGACQAIPHAKKHQRFLLKLRKPFELCFSFSSKSNKSVDVIDETRCCGQINQETSEAFTAPLRQVDLWHRQTMTRGHLVEVGSGNDGRGAAFAS